MDALAFLIPLTPLIAAAMLGVGILFNLLDGEASENVTSDIANWMITLSCFLTLTLWGEDVLGRNSGTFTLGHWLDSDTLDINIRFITTGFNVRLAALFSVLFIIVSRFSVNYLHREKGYHRFFFILCLFAAGVQLMVLSGNAVFTLIGWELAGLCSYLLVAYFYDRPVPSSNATRVAVTKRIGDAAFFAGLGFSYAWTDTLDWGSLNALAEQLTPGQATGIALCFAIAAFVKSAQLPFTPWLARAMEGPTPSSAVFYGAVMIHAGIFLVLMLEPVFNQALFALVILGIVGFTTALYSYWVGLTQTDVKSSLVYATSGQLGLMFLECSLGYWKLAGWHLCAHAVVRGYQFLTAPSLMHTVKELPVAVQEKQPPTWLYIASLQRFWLDQLTDLALIRPVRRLAQDLSYFDDQIIDRIMGVPAPALNAISTLAQIEEKMMGARLDNEADVFARGSGLAGKLTEWASSLVHWFEDRLVLRGISKDAIHFGRELGHVANKFEKTILRPRYLFLFVFITLLAAF